MRGGYFPTGSPMPIGPVYVNSAQVLPSIMAGGKPGRARSLGHHPDTAESGWMGTAPVSMLSGLTSGYGWNPHPQTGSHWQPSGLSWAVSCSRGRGPYSYHSSP